MDPVGNPYHLSDSVMQGGDVFKFAIDNAPDSISKVIEYAKSSYQEIDFFAIHQVNGQIVRTIINHAGLPKDKASAETFSKYGNCGGTSVLVNYCDQMFGKVNNSTLFVSFGCEL
ncbi:MULTISPECIES: 3-oxoacyl-[acyl-carrier-protein] synthase III C-terminal domain-containing protein [Symbiopectobacterium]|uniref:3-oxoacyl-[acyl-carrier-protein] synthase III C-terminal domain-containing protein n=1 Tax=Symbiopectobacterium TaxID=801 RepID=UPI00207A26D7|nr:MULTISPECIES: 3-oxoacyl-[acyl-carrier-protein] synthase III C-terminal domain-containing protein [Symbiopectobacterium]